MTSAGRKDRNVDRALRRSEWIERMRDMPVLEVAAELGHQTKSARGSDGGQVFGCPSCSADKRHTKNGDRRGAVGLERNGRGWRCHQCDASGDALHFVAYARHGQRFSELADSSKVDVREWCCAWLGIWPTDESSPRQSATSVPTKIPSLPAAVEEPTLIYPPPNEVTAVWNACVRVDQVPEVGDWLRSKRIDPVAVADADLARAIPLGAALPSWAALRASSWADAGYRLVAPIVDAGGTVRSLRVRNVLGGEPKSLAPRGYQSARLLFACNLTRQLLAAGTAPEWWLSRCGRIEICEGEKKFLQRTTRFSDADECVPAVIGIESGAWTGAFAARIPTGCTVFVATDPNGAGASYATKIVTSLHARIGDGSLEVQLRDEFELRESPHGALVVQVSA